MGTVLAAFASNLSDEAVALLKLLLDSANPEVVSTLAAAIADAPDRELSRINALAYAAKHSLGEEDVITALLHSARLGIFDLSWNILCPGCGGVLETSATLKSVTKPQYSCALCAGGHEATLDEMVEISFTVNPRIRRIAAHFPETLPWLEYFRQIFWSSGVALPEDDAAFEKLIDDVTLEVLELPAGERAVLSVQMPAEFLIIFDPVIHMA